MVWENIVEISVTRWSLRNLEQASTPSTWGIIEYSDVTSIGTSRTSGGIVLTLASLLMNSVVSLVQPGINCVRRWRMEWMKIEMSSVNVPMPDTIGLPGGKILKSIANVIMSLMSLTCNWFPCSVKKCFTKLESMRMFLIVWKFPGWGHVRTRGMICVFAWGCSMLLINVLNSWM